MKEVMTMTMKKTYEEIVQVVEDERRRIDESIPQKLVEELIFIESENLDDETNGLKELRKLIDKHLKNKETEYD